MTCIAVIKNKGKVYLAGDRRASNDYTEAQVLATPKVVKKGDVLIGGTGSCYLLSLATQIFNVPENKLHDPVKYIHDIFRPALERLLISRYTTKEKTLQLPNGDSVQLIVVTKGRVFSLYIGPVNNHDDGLHPATITIDEKSLPYSTGCGGHLAWGALLAIDKLPDSMKLKPRDKLRIALKCAAEVSYGCDDRCDIVRED